MVVVVGGSGGGFGCSDERGLNFKNNLQNGAVLRCTKRAVPHTSRKPI